MFTFKRVHGQACAHCHGEAIAVILGTAFCWAHLLELRAVSGDAILSVLDELRG